jgi:hypothetical protein
MGYGGQVEACGTLCAVARLPLPKKMRQQARRQAIQKAARVVLPCLFQGTSGFNLLSTSCLSEKGLDPQRSNNCRMVLCQLKRLPFFDLRGFLQHHLTLSSVVEGQRLRGDLERSR